jgi:pyruvate/2-oxoglutarate dehydrogenase complex dihydrolipoamide dehydrogenase (E3) component
MAELLTPDICVIGAGAGGLALAATAAALGVPVVLIERGPMGGDRLNGGALPAAALIAAAQRAQTIAQAPDFGVTVARPKIDFMRVHDHVSDVVAGRARNASRERLSGQGIRLIEGAARFKDPDTVAVGDAWEIKARRFVIATGSLAAVPPIAGFDDVPYLTRESALDLRVCPKHLIVVGGEPQGFELAQAFCRLGAEVTVLDPGTPLAQEDPECVDVVCDALARDGVRIRSGVAIREVRRSRGKVQIVLEGADGETIEGSHLLLAAGRHPDVAELGLDAARIRHEAQGIVVDAKLRTTNMRVYAIGDVTRGGQSADAAEHHAAFVVGHAILRRRANMNADAVPRLIATDPPLAHVGLTESQARERRYRIRVLRWPLSENDKAQAERTTAGHVKIVADAAGRILGATIVAAEAGELIVPWTLAIAAGLDIGAVAGIPMPYPVRAEAGKRAAQTYFSPGLTRTWVRRIIGSLRRRG